MKKLPFKILASLALVFIIITSCKKDSVIKSSGYTSLDYIQLPTDVATADKSGSSYIVNSQEFNSWFSSGKVSKDGSVSPANSINFPINNTNNDFNKWSQQMFLWITSPSLTPAGEKTIILETPEFYTVSPPISYLTNGKKRKKRNLISHPTTKSKTASGVGKSDTEEEQATDNVLMASIGNGKDNSLVYYITYVNDMYAQFLQAGKSNSNKYPNKLFPTTQKELDSIKAFALNQKSPHKILSPETLTMELKTSWVDLVTIPITERENYIQIPAEVPIFDRTSKTIWNNTGTTKKIKLALMGMHVVGSVKGHPEMVWATFEHQSNSPNLAYNYIDKNGKTKTVSANTGNHWLLNSKSKDTMFNKMYMTHQNGTITATKNNIISPSNTKRVHAFGNIDTISEANSQIISFNNSARNQLISGDIRKNYIFIGAIWTNDGKLPEKTNLQGNTALANSTMETNFQGNSTNCFSCHGFSLNPNTAFDLSHIYALLKEGEILPLETTN